MKNYFRIALTALLIETSLTGAAHGEIRKKIDETTARRLLKQAYGKTGRGSFDYDAGMDNHFYEYAGISPPEAEGMFGYFAVNPWTGDVWNLWGCHKLSTPALRASQAKIRQRFTPDELKQYDRLSRLKPFCTVEN